jgi:5-methylcytosine-specific restriction endonuclease McrA
VRRCLWCGSPDQLTRDHVVARVQLKLALGQDRYHRYCATTRKLNIMTLCTTCNNDKGDRNCDLRDADTQQRLIQTLRDYGIDDVIEWSEPEHIFTRSYMEHR